MATAKKKPIKRSKATTQRRESSEKAARTQRANFSNGITKWLESRKYQIGISPKDVNFDEDVKTLKTLVKVGKALISTAVPFFISAGGVDSSQVFDALVPFVPLSDLLGFKVETGDAYIASVIYADDLDATVISARVEQLLQLAQPLAEFGVRMNGQSLATAYVHVLLVYFDAESYAAAVSLLQPQGAKRNVMKHTYLYTGFIDVSGRTVVWSEESGILGGIRKSMANLLGTTKKALQIFDASDLQSVLILSG